MFGRVIGTSVAVDWFHGITKNGMYFLSENLLREPLPDHVDRVFTSIYNAEFLQTICQLDPDRITGLQVNQKLLIEDNVKKLNFCVTLIDAHQKPGAIMFLFEGEGIGNVLYAGRCLYKDNSLGRPIISFLKRNVLDTLYIHEVCPDCENHSVTISGAVQYILNMIKKRPKCRVTIHEPCYREDILDELKTKFRKPLCVSMKIMAHLKKKGKEFDFTIDQNASRVFVTHQYPPVRSLTRENFLTFVIMPCSMKRSTEQVTQKLIKFKGQGLTVALYRNHCTSPELTSLVHDIGAKRTILLRPRQFYSPFATRPKDLNFWTHLGNVNELLDSVDPELQETQEPVQECGLDAEITPLSSVDCINHEGSGSSPSIEHSHIDSLNLAKVNQNKCSVSSNCVTESLIVIESDVESVLSEETIANPNTIGRQGNIF